MPDLKPEALLKMSPNRRWSSRVHHAWFELRGNRPEDARLYTDYAPRVEIPRKDGSALVDRETLHGQGKIQIWRPGTPPKGSKGAMVEMDGDEPWYGFSATVEKSTDYAVVQKHVVDLLSKLKE